MIPKKIMEEYLPIAKGATIFGAPLSELSKDELMVCAAMGWKAEQRARENARKRSDLSV